MGNWAGAGPDTRVHEGKRVGGLWPGEPQAAAHGEEMYLCLFAEAENEVSIEGFLRTL